MWTPIGRHSSSWRVSFLLEVVRSQDEEHLMAGRETLWRTSNALRAPHDTTCPVIAVRSSSAAPAVTTDLGKVLPRLDSNQQPCD